MNKPLKIALTGAHGTGKTTLSGFLQNLLQPKYSIITTAEVPRIVIGEVHDPHFYRRDNNNFNRQCNILARQIEIEANAMQTDNQIVLCDRTIADHWAYTVSLFPEQVGSIDAQIWENLVESWLQSYDLIIRLPCEFAPIDDGVRESDLEYQYTISRSIEAIYNSFHINTVTVTGSVESRADQCLSFLSPKLAP